MNIKFELTRLINGDVITTSGLYKVPLCSDVNHGTSWKIIDNDGTYFYLQATDGGYNTWNGKYPGDGIGSPKISIDCNAFDANGKQERNGPVSGEWYHVDADGDLHRCTDNSHHCTGFSI